MKKLLFLLSAFILTNSLLFAQAPQGINYQGVARNSSGAAIGTTTISVQITVLQNGSSVMYQEHQTVQTDTFGLYSLVIGGASAIVTQGAFASIPWSGGNLSVKVDIDLAGGSAYTTVSSMNLQSVPYALYAQNSGNSSNGTVTNVSATAPLSVSNPTSTPSLSISQANLTNDGYLSAADWNSFNNKVSSITGGTGILITNAGQVYTISADNNNAIWNAGKMQGIPVSSTAPLTNDILQYNGTNWTPLPFSGLPIGTNGQMLFNNAGVWAPSNPNNLFFTGSMMGIGTPAPGAALDVQTSATGPAIKATNSGAGPAIISNGPLQLNGVILDAGVTTGTSGDILVSQGSTLGPKWISPSSLGGLPPPQLGSLLFGNTTTTWAATNPSQVFSDGNSITVTNTTTVGTAGTFITNNPGASNAPALLAQSNSSTGYALRADNSAGAAILASSGGPYVITANLSGGGGNGVEGNLVNGANGKGIVGSVDISSTGNAGYFENTNGSNTQPVLKVSNIPGSAGFSGVFNGGAGLQTDKVQITVGAVPGAVLVSSNTNGDAIWSGAVNFAAQGGSTSTTSGAPTAIVFGTVNYSVPAGLLSGGSTFTVPANANGLYHFDSGVSLNIATGLASPQDIIMRLVVGGSTYREALVHLPTGFAGVVQNQISADAQLTAGQTVQIQVFQTTGQSLTVMGGAPAVQTFFNGHLVH